jgi:GNAT superfamily N-acetyltransferase
MTDLTCDADGIAYEWRGEFTSSEVNALHAQAFGTRLFSDEEWSWRELAQSHSAGWVVARRSGRLVGFVNVPWDGFTHAWVQDTMVSADSRGDGIGTKLVQVAREGAKASGCEWLHVDFEDDLRSFYFDACGFKPTNAGLIRL